MTPCPQCNKRLEPLLTPHHLIHGNQILAVCSSRCRVELERRLARRGFSLSFLGALGQDRLTLLLTGMVVLSSVGLFLLLGLWIQEPLTSQGSFHPFLMPPLGRVKVRFGAPRRPVVETQEERKERTLHHHERAKALLLEMGKGPCGSLWCITGLEVLSEGGVAEANTRLKSMLSMERGPRRNQVAQALARLGDKSALLQLRGDLYAQNPTISSMAALALGQLGDKRAQNSLRQLMRFKQTRYAAAEAALRLGNGAAKSFLYGRATTAKRVGDRVRAAASLARAGDRRMVPLLREALNNGEFSYLAALGLAALGKREALPMLRKAVLHVSLRLEAARALARLQSFEMVTPLARLLSSSSISERITAAAAVFVLTSRQLAQEKSVAPVKGRETHIALTDWMEQWLRL